MHNTQPVAGWRVWSGLVASFVLVSIAGGSHTAVSVVVPLAAVAGGAAAAFWLGDAVHASASSAARAAAIAGVGALLATVVAFTQLGVGFAGDAGRVWSGPLVGLGFGLINLGLSTLSGVLVWVAVSEASDGEPLDANAV